MASYVIPSILEPLTDDESEPEGSLTESIAAKDRAASSPAKGPASKGQPKTADRRRFAAVDSQVWPSVNI